MNNQEAIKILQDCKDRSFNHYTIKEHDEALDMAISILTNLDKIKTIVSLWVYSAEQESSDAYCNVLDLINKYAKGEAE